MQRCDSAAWRGPRFEEDKAKEGERMSSIDEKLKMFKPTDVSADLERLAPVDVSEELARLAPVDITQELERLSKGESK